jgi:hypothetical protein
VFNAVFRCCSSRNNSVSSLQITEYLCTHPEGGNHSMKQTIHEIKVLEAQMLSVSTEASYET